MRVGMITSFQFQAKLATHRSVCFGQVGENDPLVGPRLVSLC